MKLNNSMFNNENHLAVMQELYGISSIGEIVAEFCNTGSAELDTIE
jgi:hypothetical protein